MQKVIAKYVAYRRSPVKVADKAPLKFGDATTKYKPKQKESKSSPFSWRRGGEKVTQPGARQKPRPKRPPMNRTRKAKAAWRKY